MTRNHAMRTATRRISSAPIAALLTGRGMLFLLALLAASAGSAHAQGAAPAPPAAPSKGYVEVFAQSAFGNVTSQAYGGEVGYTVRKNLQVFVEFGQVRDAAPAEFGAAAQLIAISLAETQGDAAFTAKEPATFGVGGVKYLIPMSNSRIEPYVMGGAGIAKVSKNVTFVVNGVDVTNQLTNLVVIGSDLSGDFTKPIVMFGGGVAWPFWRQAVVDFQYRFSHIVAEGDSVPALNFSRAGIALGIRF
jgi:opacity protein-like surface antigen